MKKNNHKGAEGAQRMGMLFAIAAHSPFVRLMRLCGKILLFLCLTVSLFAQEAVEDEDWDWEDLPVFEDVGLTITGTKETSQQMKVVNREDIEKANAPDLAALLEETAGLSTARYGPHGSQGDINLRGMDAERVAFLIDGVPANSPASSEFDFNQIDLNAIEKIEVIYGGSDSRYNVSGAIGGVINIITIKQQKPGLRLSGGLSNMSAMPGPYYKPYAGNQDPQGQDLFDTQNLTLSAGLGLKNMSFNLNWFGSRAGNHYLFDDNFGRRRRKENSEVLDTGLSAGFVREFSDLSKLIVNGSFYYGDKNFTASGYSEEYTNVKDVSTRENVMWEMPRAFHDTLETEASLSHTLQNQDSGDKTTIQALMAINRWAWYPLPVLTLRAGWDYRYALAETQSFHDHHDGGFSIGAEWLPFETLTLIPSIKLALQSSLKSGGEAVAVPKFGVHWKPFSSLMIKNNYFRSYKIPDMVDLYWQGEGGRGDPDLKPEDGWGTDLGAAWNGKTEAGLGLGLEGNAFAQWYDRSIHWYNGRPRNVGGSFYYGLDAAARFTLPLNKGPFVDIRFSLTYQYMMSWVLAYGYTWEDDIRIPYMPVHRPGGKVELAWKTGSLALAGTYEAERLSEDFTTLLDPWFYVTINANQKIGKGLNAFAVIRNAFDQRYESFMDYPMPGITLTLGVRARLEINREGAGGM